MTFRSTTNPPVPTPIKNTQKILVDPFTGAPVGMQDQSDSGNDGMWAPVLLSAAQIAAPDPLIIADTHSTFQLNVAPYTRYQSDGTELISLAPTPEYIVPSGFNELLYAPLTVSPPTVLIVQGIGSITVITQPA